MQYSAFRLCALPTPASSGAASSMRARHSSALPAASARAQAAIAIIHASPEACAILSASSAVSFASSDRPMKAWIAAQLVEHLRSEGEVRDRPR